MRRIPSGGRRRTSEPQHDTTALVAQRLEAIERLVAEQRERIAQQDDELKQLRASLASSAAESTHAASAAEVEQPGEQPVQAHERKGGPSTTRRTLLMMGGTAAAVAAIEAVALNANTPSAQARGARPETGVSWQTGTVSADTETLVKQSSSSYPSNDILQVQLGTGTVFTPATLKAAITAYDTTTNNIGVYGTSQTGYGLYGVTNSGNGAKGAGLSGAANTGVGVAGVSTAGIGVSGNSQNGLGGSFTGGQAPIALGLGGGVGAPTSGAHITGEVYADGNADLWVCVSPGTPGSWNKLAHLAPGYTSGGAITYLPHPIRLLDTRKNASGANQLPGVPCSASSPTTVNVAGVNFGGVQVPASASGAIGNVTVVVPSGSGYVALVPSGVGFQGTSNLNYSAGAILANSFNVGLNGGKLDVIIASGTNSVDVLIDLFAVVA